MSAVNEWLAMFHVHEGGVTMLEGCFFNQGRLVGDYLAVVLVELIRTGHLALGAAVLSGQQQVCVTHSGQLRYRELNSNAAREGRHRGR